MLQVEEARAYSNLGSSHHYRRNFAQAISYHENVLRIAQELGDHAVEARAYAGLGHAARCAGDYTQVWQWCSIRGSKLPFEQISVVDSSELESIWIIPKITKVNIYLT
jgi:hypothetical protein